MFITLRTVPLSKTAFSAPRRLNPGMPTTFLYGAPRMAATAINCTLPRPLLRALLLLYFGVYGPFSSLSGPRGRVLLFLCLFTTATPYMMRPLAIPPMLVDHDPYRVFFFG